MIDLLRFPLEDVKEMQSILKQAQISMPILQYKMLNEDSTYLAFIEWLLENDFAKPHTNTSGSSKSVLLTNKGKLLDLMDYHTQLLIQRSENVISQHHEREFKRKELELINTQLLEIPKARKQAKDANFIAWVSIIVAIILAAYTLLLK